MRAYHVIPIIIFMLALPLVQACMSPADVYAVEVVFNKPGIVYKPYPAFNALHNALVENGTFIFRSHYDKRLYVLLLNASDGPHLRIQIPVKWESEDVSRASLNVSLLVTSGALEKLKADGWKVIDNTTFKKGGVRVALYPIKGKECTSDSDCATGGCSGELCVPRREASNIVTPCVYRPWYTCFALTSCGCVNGVCTWKPNPAFESCLKEHGVDPARVIKAGLFEVDVEGTGVSEAEINATVREFLEAFGISCSKPLRITKTSVTRLVPAVDPSEVNASEAVKAELEWLATVGVLKIDEKDIEAIARTAEWGDAGWNSHIGWYETKDGTYTWIPYDKSLNPELIKCFTKTIPKYRLPNGTAYVGPTMTTPPATTKSSTTSPARDKVCGPAFIIAITILPLLRRK
ncbi:CGP-CTERM-anchored Cys-rich protein [Thermococcus stetteri]|uniref:CGP-CTERM-anchored Cys-rich protein n=1 Tax=Thermococcus stetteri TaxID=49900 RepID=UPI001AE8CE37|nr:CGP-CTERM-anchored Cys-rich protein [Thermococcus stetteri]